MEFYFSLTINELPKSKGQLVELIVKNSISHSDLIYFYDKFGDQVEVDDNSFEYIREAVDEGKVKFFFKKRNPLSETIIRNSYENISKSESINLVESIVLSLNDMKTEENKKNESNLLDSYLKFLFEKIDLSLVKETSLYKIFNKLEGEFFSDNKKIESLANFNKVIEKLDTVFQKLNTQIGRMEINILKLKLAEEDAKTQFNKLNLEREEYYKKNIIKEEKIKDEVTNKFKSLIIESEDKIKDEVTNKFKSLIKESEEKLNELKLKYETLEKESKNQDEKNLNTIKKLREFIQTLTQEKFSLLEEIDNLNKEKNNSKLSLFCKHLIENVNFENILKESLLNTVNNQAKEFIKDENEKTQINEVIILMEKIDNSIINHKKNLIIENNLNEDLDKMYKESQKVINDDIIILTEFNQRLQSEYQVLELEKNKLLNQLNEKESELFLTTEKLNEISKELENLKKDQQIFKKHFKNEEDLNQIKQKLSKLYKITINLCSYLKDEESIIAKYKKNFDEIEKNNNLHVSINNLISDITDIIQKHDELDLLKIFDFNVNILQKYRICNFCHQLKEISDLKYLCEQHCICSSCGNSENFTKCINCGWKCYFD